MRKTLFALLLVAGSATAQIPTIPDIDFQLIPTLVCKDSIHQIEHPFGNCGSWTIRNTKAPNKMAKVLGCYTGDGMECSAEEEKTYAIRVDVIDEEHCQNTRHYLAQATVDFIYNPFSWNSVPEIGWKLKHIETVPCNHNHPPCVNTNFDW